MGDYRARDADRDRHVELIEAAYADGQLGAEDRELRVARALTAASLSELEALTRDLQAPPGSPSPALPPAQPVVQPGAPAPSRPVSRPPRSVGALVALGLVAVFAVGAGSVALLAGSAEPESTSSSGVVEQPTESPVEETAGFELGPRTVRAFLRDYEAQFATLEAHDVVLHPTRVFVEVPVRGSRPRAEDWSYDGAWRRESAASSAIRFPQVVDLGGVSVRRLFANIAVARRTLDVERAQLTHVVVRRNLEGTPTVNIYVGNSFDESGYLMTTLSGEILRRFPAS